MSSPDGRAGTAATAPVERRPEIMALIGGLVAGATGWTARLDDDTPLTATGLDSLGAIELCQALESRLGVTVSLAELFDGLTAGELAVRLAVAVDRVAAAGEPLPGGDDAEGPLSFGQRALWFLHHLAPESAAYNIAAAARVRSPLDIDALRRALRAVVERHAALRTTFPAVDGEPRQRVGACAAIELAVISAAGWSAARLRTRIEQEASRPFALAAGPLLRLAVFAPADGGSVVVLVIHHAVADFTSMAILARDLGASYAAETGGPPMLLAPPRSSHLDFARWQHQRLAAEPGERLWEWWRERLRGAPLQIEIPTDRPRPPVQSHAGAAVSLRLDQRLTTAAGAFCSARGTTLYTLLLAVFQLLLHRYTGLDIFVVGSPASGRTRPDLQDVVGLFTNPVMMRADLSGLPAFTALLEQTRRSVLDALDHQDLPLALLAERLQPERDASRSPLFQAMLTLYRGRGQSESALSAFALGEPGSRLRLGGLELESMSLRDGFAQLDLALSAAALEEGLILALRYRTDLFDASTARRALGHLGALLAGAVAEPERIAGELPLLTTAESHQLREWNDTGTARGDGSLVELFEQQVDRAPEAVALVHGALRLTYRALDEQANRLAAHLLALGVGPETPVAVLLERTLELPVALVGIMKAGAAYVPLDPAYPPARLELLLDDSRAAWVVTRRDLQARVALPEGRRRAVLLEADAVEIAGRSPCRPANRSAPEHLAYLIYTSGSSGRPKAVAIEHRQAAALVRWAGRSFSPDELNGVLFSTSVCFDLSIFELFAPLTLGGRVVLADNALELPTLAAAPEVRLINTVPSVMAELLAAGTLPRGPITVCLAGEPLRAALVRRIFAASPAAAVWNLYGPSEDTTYSTGVRIPAEGSTEPSIGRPLTGRRAHVLDRRLQPLPVGVPGELCLGGDGLARGYLDRPELTAERFVPASAGEAGERLYRTGDLARWRANGELELLGRIDDQVKIRGYRIELGEIESALACQAGLREAAVLARDDAAGGRRLVAYVVPAVAPHLGWQEELRTGLRDRLPEVMVPADVVVLDELPRTLNGKVDRRRLAALEARPAPSPVPSPGRPLADLIASIWAGALGLDRLGPDESFFDRGGHSLLAARAAARLNAALDTDLKLSAIFEAPTAALLAERIQASAAGRSLPPLARVPRPEGEAPASFAQERLWFLDRLDPGSPIYNMAAALRLAGALVPAGLEHAVRGVWRRHESLRTHFRVVAGRLRQVVAPGSDLPLPRIDLGGLPSVRRRVEGRRLLAAAARRPFDLASGPMLRGLLLRQAPDDHRLLLVCHHAVADGWSLRNVVAPELAVLYAAATGGREAILADLPVQYADWSSWQRRCLDEERLQEETAHWRGRLAGAGRLDLPADRPPPAIPGNHGGTRALQLRPETAQAAGRLARETGATRFMVLLAAFQAFLGRLTGQDDFLIGTVVDQRDRQELDNVVGLFVNTLALRAHLAGAPSFGDLLARTRAACLDAWAHRELPFERLAEELGPAATGGGAALPALAAVFTLQEDVALPALPGLDLSVVEIHTGTAKFELALQARGTACLTLDYAADRFDATTAARWLEGFAIFLAGALERPDGRLSLLPLLSRAGRHQVLSEWNDTARSERQWRPVHEWVAARAAAAPDALAVAGEPGSLGYSYGGLERRAHAVARRLLARGVVPGVPVAVLATRGPSLIAALYGVLKAGAAYLALDPDHPAERLAFMARDAGVPMVLAEPGLQAAAAACGVPTVLLEPEELQQSGECAAAAVPTVPPESLAYVIYTSGSTGRPKGVQIPHGGLVNLVRWHHAAYRLVPSDRVSQVAGLGFDASVWEIWPCLAAGASLWLAPEEVRPSPPRLRDWLARQGIDLSFLPTPLAEAALAGPWPAALALRALLTGGDRLQRRPGRGRGFRLVNHYGPTESSVVATVAEVAPEGPGAPLIGRPVDNHRVYLLDAEMQPVPPPAPGEIFLGGAGLARGYAGRPDLTAERFVPDPFASEPGSRLYRTGDRARHELSGALEFLGRLDEQLEVRGVRIEPGEIEAALDRCPGVRTSAVTRCDGAQGGPCLAAWWVAEEGVPAPSDAEIRSFLRDVLPEVMIPEVFVPLTSLPLTDHGKVDRRALGALPAAVTRRTATTAVWVAPRTPLEQVLAGMWCEVLGVERVGVHDDFFALGGHSLQAAELVAAVEESFDMQLSLRAFFAASTVAGLAARLLEAADPRASRARVEAAAEVLLEISRLSDLEIEPALAAAGASAEPGKAR
jgi:amino acid adenylation domain-containing protein